MSKPPRVLIDFDYGAAGIWKVLSSAEMNAPAPTDEGWTGHAPLVSEPPRLRPWSDRISEPLLDALTEWNDLGVQLVNFEEGKAPELDAFWARGAQLAKEVQDELGSDYEVLYAAPEDAWRWVDPPWSSDEEPRS